MDSWNLSLEECIVHDISHNEKRFKELAITNWQDFIKEVSEEVVWLTVHRGSLFDFTAQPISLLTDERVLATFEYLMEHADNAFKDALKTCFFRECNKRKLFSN